MSPLASRGEDPWDIRWPLAVNVVLLLGCAAAYSLSVGAERFLTAFSVLLAVAAASWTVGALLGFIFGVPRRVGEQPTGDQSGDVGLEGSTGDAAALVNRNGLSSAGRYVTNSNLAQISDWLTKILIGAGLVQLSELPGALRAASDFVAGSIPGSGAPAFAAGLIVFGITSGFILTFLWTTLTARRLYETVEERVDLLRRRIRTELRSLPDVGVQVEEAESVERAEPEPLAPSIARQVSRVADAVQDFTQKYGTEQLAPSDYRRLARQLRAAGRYQEAYEMYLRAAEADPRDPEPLAYAGAIASRFLKQYETADQLYARALAIDPNHGPTLYNRACNAARKGNVQEALVWLEQAIQQNPNRYRQLAIRDSLNPDGPFFELRDNLTFRRLTET